MVVVGFFNLHRTTELVAADAETWFDVGKHPRYIDCAIVLGGIRYTVMSQKTRYRVAEVCVLTQAEWPECAYKSFMRYYFARNKGLLRGHVALFVKESGSLPTWSWMNQRLKIIQSDLVPHCIRVGGATKMALDNKSALCIQMRGRWSSDAFIAYIRVHGEFLRTLEGKANLPVGFTRG